MTEGIRVLIVDDQPRARQSMKALLATMPQVGDVREAEGGKEAIEAFGEMNPDVVLMDVVMPEMDGLQATRLIKNLQPQARVVILTLYSDYRQDAFAAGADRFVTKGGPSDEIFAAVLGDDYSETISPC